MNVIKTLFTSYELSRVCDHCVIFLKVSMVRHAHFASHTWRNLCTTF